MKRIAIVALAALTLTVTGCAGGAAGGGSDHYLEAVCPTETALGDYQTALDAQDLASATTNAGVLANALEATIATLGDSGTAWADGVDPEDITTLHDAYATDLKKLQALSAPGTLGDKPFIFDYPGSDEAIWRIHEALGLPRSLADACSVNAS